jgi:predicted amidohydrolase
MEKSVVRVALAQIQVEVGDVYGNLRRARKAIDEAKMLGAAVILLPECMDFGWCSKESTIYAHPIPGAFSAMLVEASKETGLFVVAGLTERAGDTLFNAAVLIDPVQGLIGTHRKIHELAFAQELYSIGSKLEVFETSLGKIAIPICADLLATETGVALGKLGAEIILSPTSWAVPPDFDDLTTPYGAQWIDAYRSISAAFKIPVAGVSNIGKIEGGPWDQWPVIGRSLAIDRDGRILALAKYNNEDLLLVEF